MSLNSDGVARKRAPCRRDKRPDPCRVLDARRALDTGGEVHASSAAQRDRRLDGLLVQAPGQQPGNGGTKLPRQAPVERTAVAAWQDCALGRLGVDQQMVGDALV